MRNDNGSVAMAIEHEKQNVDDPAQVDTLVASFLVGMAKANGMDEARLALEMRRFFDHCRG